MAETLQIAARYRDGVVHKTEAMYFHNVIETCEAAMKVESVAIAHPHETVVFLGEGYYLWNVMPWEVEYHIYKTIIQSIIARGYRVYWKEHPKSTHHFGESLQDAFGKSRLTYTAGDNFWPIEFLIGKTTPVACVSILSTTLFTLPLLYGFRTFHASRYFKKYLTHGEKLAMKLVTEKIADLEELEPISSP
jgi:hypothetical protein